MSIKDDGGPAYPNPELGRIHFSDPGAYTGVSIRDVFAMKALEGILSSCSVGQPSPEVVAEASYTYADAMLKVRQS